MEGFAYPELIAAVVKYSQMYPEDSVVVGGGYSAYLQLRSVGVTIDVKDLDLFVTTKASGKERMNRWTALLPNSSVTWEDCWIFTVTSSEGHSMDVLVNQETILRSDAINGVRVKTVTQLLEEYKHFIEGAEPPPHIAKRMQEMGMPAGYSSIPEEERVKIERVKERYGLLVKHFPR